MIKLEYAIKNQQLVHISEVESGLKCRCFCPACKDRLIAKKGNMKRHHFSHASSDCSHGVESALHIMAKEILEEEKRIFLPEVNIELPSLNLYKAVLYPEGIMEFDEVVLEQRQGSIIPDIMVRKGNSWLIIEIFVTHKVDDDKLQLIKKAGISALEINLSGLESMPTKEELKNMLLTNMSPIFWLLNKKRDYCWNNWLMRCSKMPSVLRGCAVHVDNCPIKKREWRGKYYANLFDDCWQCDYYIWAVHDDAGNETGIYCSGKTGIKTLEALKDFLHRERQRQSEAKI